MSTRQQELQPDLGAVDFTLLVIGAVIGADVYIVSGLGARYLGPAQLVAWVVAGLLCVAIALAFVQCSAVIPKVGGSYSYAHQAFGPLAGFMTGWSLYVGEAIALPVFPVAFVNYLGYFVHGLTRVETVAVEALLVAVVTAANLFGVRSGGRLNDVLTLTKLAPLALLAVVGLVFAVIRAPVALDHLHPFVPLGWHGFGSAVVLIFWAYAGFELAVLPAGEVRDPAHVLPRGLVIGIAVAGLFYLLTALAVAVALPTQTVAASPRPLADALQALVGGLSLPAGWCAALMSVGAAVSILGVFDVFMLSVARLSYALAADGFFPRMFASVHPRFHTPWMGLLFQAAIAFVGSIFFDLSHLIAASMLFLGFCYTVTCVAAVRLSASEPASRLHVPGLRGIFIIGAVGGVYLSSQVPTNLMWFGAAMMLAGLLLYAVRGDQWRADAIGMERLERRVEQTLRRRERWFWHFVRRAGER